MKDSDSNQDSAFNEMLPAPEDGRSSVAQPDRHQARIVEYKSQIVEHPDPLLGAMGGHTADMLTLAKQVGDGIRKAIPAEGANGETLRDLAPVFNMFQSLTRQISRNTSTIQRVEEIQRAEMLELTPKKSPNLAALDVQRRKLNAHRSAWEEKT